MVLIKPMCDVSKTNYTNLVIGYFNGKVIVKNDFGHLYYMICEEQIAPVGTFLESDLLAPVKNLPEAEQAEIYAIYGWGKLWKNMIRKAQTKNEKK